MNEATDVPCVFARKSRETIARGRQFCHSTAISVLDALSRLVSIRVTMARDLRDL
jgi:hypothetical protein